MPAIFALSRAQLLLLVVTRSRDLSRECHVTKHKTPARSNFPLSNFENSGTIQFSSSSSTKRGLCPKNVETRAHPNNFGGHEDVKDCMQRVVRSLQEDELFQQHKKLRDHCQTIIEAGGDFSCQKTLNR